jgi:hypothetical protein
MSKAKYTYAVEAEWLEGWRPIIDAETRDFCRGYVASHRHHPGPRVTVRTVRSDGMVFDCAPGEERASLGMVAGFPTAEQYERAAERALASAAEVREREARRKARVMGDPTGGQR